jgi:hypothetical protein
MKNLFVILFALLIYSRAYCVIKTVVSNSGQGWGNSGNWSPAGVPVDGDEIEIPVGKIISVKGTFYNGTENLKINVNGTLDFDPSGKLNLGILSIVQLYTPTSTITTNGSASELIIINGQTKYQGNVDGTLNGPKYASNATLSSPNGFVLGIVPVKLISFIAHSTKEEVILKWKTADEIYTVKFNIERSNDGRNWNTLNFVLALGSNSNYTFTDPSPLGGDNYYRLKSIDADGFMEYSPVVKIKQTDTQRIKIGTNSAILVIYLQKPLSSPCRIQLFNEAGQIARDELFNQQSTTIQIETGGLNKGVYFVKLASEEFVFQKGIIIR